MKRKGMLGWGVGRKDKLKLSKLLNWIDPVFRWSKNESWATNYRSEKQQHPIRQQLGSLLDEKRVGLGLGVGLHQLPVVSVGKGAAAGNRLAGGRAQSQLWCCLCPERYVSEREWFVILFLPPAHCHMVVHISGLKTSSLSKCICSWLCRAIPVTFSWWFCL